MRYKLITMKLINIIIFLLSNIIIFNVNANEINNINLDFSRDIVDIKKLEYKGHSEEVVNKYLEYWKKITAFENAIEERRKKGEDISESSPRYKPFYDFRRELDILIWNRAREYPSIRQMYFNEFKEKGYSAGVYIRSAKDPNVAVHELFGARQDKDYEIIKSIFDYYVDGYDKTPERWLTMTNEMFTRMSKNASGRKIISEYGYVLHENDSIRCLKSSNFKFVPGEITKDEFHSRSIKVFLDNMNKIVGADKRKREYNYYFGINENKDFVMDGDYGLWWTQYRSLVQQPGYTLENLKKYTPEEKGYYRTFVLAFRASLGDKSIKDELRSDLENMKSIPMTAFFLNMYGEIADQGDLPFLKKLKSKDIVYKATPLDIEDSKADQAAGQQCDIRLEISPITEAVSRIYKKMEFKE